MLTPKTDRLPITLETTERALYSALSLGNPGGLNAMVHLIKQFPVPNQLYLDLNDMNLRGPRLAAAFDVADRDPVKLNELVTARSKDLVTKVNELAGGPTRSQQAVCNGGTNL